MDYKKLQKILSDTGIEFSDGLSDDEMYRIEFEFQFVFPEELKIFLQTGLPVGENFPNWRKLNDVKLKNSINWPLEGLLFDVENNNFWLSSLGEKPADIRQAKEKITNLYNTAPKLIPVYGHRYMPALEDRAKVPVLSVHQTDIIYYGSDLENYLDNEFIRKSRFLRAGETIKSVPFWSEIIHAN